MEKSDLIKILQGDIDLINAVNVHDVALFEDHIVIYPKDVASMLKKFLSRYLSADELTRWAKFLCMRAEYSSPDWRDEKMPDYYEDMWYVIQRLSTPEIDGEITRARVKQYLIELKKYNNDPYPGSPLKTICNRGKTRLVGKKK